MRNLPIDLLRTLVAFAESESLAGAARHVGRSISAVSLHLKQLQEVVDAPLLEKSGRRLILTSSGRLLLAHARRMLAENDRAFAALGRTGKVRTARLGLVQDFAGDVLSDIIAELAAAEPEIDLAVQIGNSSELIRQLGEDAIDVALVAWTPGPPKPFCELEMAWFGQACLLDRDLLPLALVSRPCPFWSAAEAALNNAGRDFTVVMETPSLDGVRAAIKAGFGLGCRTRLAFSSDIRMLGSEYGLPPLSPIAYTAQVRPRPTPAASLLHDVAIQYLIPRFQLQQARQSNGAPTY